MVAFAQTGSGPTAIIESRDLKGTYCIKVLSEPPDLHSIRIEFRAIGYRIEGWKPVSDCEAEFAVRGPRGRLLSRDLRPYVTGIRQDAQSIARAAE